MGKGRVGNRRIIFKDLRKVKKLMYLEYWING